MELTSLTLTNFKRFEGQHTINLAGNIIALIGPNEAGKSTFLEALRWLTANDILPIQSRTRGTEGRVSVRAHYILDDQDRQALKDISGGDTIRSWTLETWTDDDKEGIVSTCCPSPERNMEQRQELLAEFTQWIEHPGIKDRFKSAGGVRVSRVIASVTSALQSTAEDLTQSELSAIHSYAQVMRQFPEVKRAGTKNSAVPHTYSEFLDRMVAYDEGVSPREQASDLLIGRQPQILAFASKDRDLRSTYNLDEVYANPPRPLRHLAQMAEIDLAQLRKAAAEQRRADLRRLLNQANRRLEELFTEAWDQSPISVELNIQWPILEVMITTPEGSYSMIEERSDGLRAFIALRAFLESYDLQIPPILIVDEAETHLHYDAQANLVDLFTDQNLAAKVVYTTHSIGCLPRDLGTGIRVVEPIQDERSRIKSSVWEHRSPGFSPLIVGLGAATFGFLPARNVVFGEGPTEAMLLPTLLREVMEVRNLPFQVAPGLASIDPKRMADLVREGGAVAFLTDGDEEGRTYRKQLLEAGVAPESIVGLDEFLGYDATIEDLVLASAYLSAVSAVLTENGNGDKTPTLSEIPGVERTIFIKKWCRRRRGVSIPGKTRIAQQLLNQKLSGRAKLVDPDKVNALRKLGHQLNGLFKVGPR